MSIMQAEAEQAASRIYLTAHDPLSSLQEAYRTGRSAEPTDAEIEAAAKALFRGELYRMYHAVYMDGDDHLADAWEHGHQAMKDFCRDQARAALLAVRKAVA